MKIYIITMDILFGTTRGESDRTSETQGEGDNQGRKGTEGSPNSPSQYFKSKIGKISIN